ncbi:cilia- and flagella-associated protein 45 isoform X1 [Tribolium castaneum]|uniref:Cilia- and flagella-associated protein 45 n=2 Tax=Tribolium castaneum TaxID=7070 RepID=D6WRB9_TRICA|nr:PREDICTED: cilia- and flagella-associated protein 45 isoform X1 [Tribolium castaneum]EFA06544.2 Coiled-coil domain-containing protein 19, mitochondrial-like Protein [Tribolium castaneum]|eukprot:XP_008195146.1 PREDICTED: cilia- and flagella-associated protein 45 isoform X1 [Tribolium castaneum]
MSQSRSKKPSMPTNRPKPHMPVIDEKMCFKAVKKPKEFVTAYDVQGMRRLMVPDRNPIDIPGILPKSEFERLKNQAHIVTLKDRMMMLDEAEQKKNALQRESEKRKEFLQKVQKKQTAKPGTTLSDVEREAKSRNMYLLKRSFDLMQEQDNRVKRANGVILATKCRAIRNAQIAEKELIEKQLQEENRRLDLMMEQQRQKAMEEEAKRKQEEERKKQNYVTALSDQMRMNEIERMIEAEQKEEESRMINKAFLAIQQEEEQKLREKKELQQKIRNDLKKANDDLERYKLIQKEEQRIADLRIQKFMQEKLDREMARDQELALAKAAKEQEIIRMRNQQQRSQDIKAAMDEMNALRIQEEVERKWREKEIAAAKAKKEQQEMLKLEREKQINDLRRAAAITLARDEEDFHRVAKVQREQWEKEMELNKRKKEKAEQHRTELLKQINEKEKERIVVQKEKFEEANLQQIEQQRKDLHVKEHLRQKIEALRNKQLPERYIKDIEHHIEGIINTE